MSRRRISRPGALLVAAVLLAASGHPAAAQAPAQAAAPTPPTSLVASPPMRLEDAIKGALGGGPATQREDEKVNRAAGRLQQAAGAFDWNASAETGWERLYVARSRDGVLTTDTEAVDTLHTQAGISRRFRNGIEVRPGISYFSETGGVSAGQTSGLTKTRPMLGLSVPLLRGFGDDTADAAELSAQETLAGSRLGREFAAVFAANAGDDNTYLSRRPAGAPRAAEVLSARTTCRSVNFR